MIIVDDTISVQKDKEKEKEETVVFPILLFTGEEEDILVTKSFRSSYHSHWKNKKKSLKIK